MMRKLLCMLLSLCLILGSSVMIRAEAPVSLDELMEDIESEAELDKDLSVAPLKWELSADRRCVHITRPTVYGAVHYTVAFNIYREDGTSVSYFYAYEDKVTFTAGTSGVFNVFVVVTDTDTGATDTQNTGWLSMIGPIEPLMVGTAVWEISSDKSTITVNKPTVLGGSGDYKVAYVCYDDQGGFVDALYSEAASVDFTPGYEGKFIVFITVTDNQTGETYAQNTGWNKLGGTDPEPYTPMTVGTLSYEVSADGKSIFIDRPDIAGGSGQAIVAYNLYDDAGNVVLYFYSEEIRVAMTPKATGTFCAFVTVTDIITRENSTQNTGWQALTE
ncbi:MAG: hypothetical protein IKP40_06435 [Clostridia bacterium]|nr:hypothetical protein [Clostridia bacterium]